jgi:hypothetical protein
MNQKELQKQKRIKTLYLEFQNFWYDLESLLDKEDLMQISLELKDYLFETFNFRVIDDDFKRQLEKTCFNFINKYGLLGFEILKLFVLYKVALLGQYPYELFKKFGS